MADVSQMQALGVDLATIQSLVGHADVDMTKHYLHVQDPVRMGAIRKFDEAFFEKKVFLQLYVKVEKDWRNRERKLRNFGYQLEHKES